MEDVNLPTTRSGERHAFGFVTFSSEQAVQKALDQPRRELGKRIVSVECFRVVRASIRFSLKMWKL